MHFGAHPKFNFPKVFQQSALDTVDRLGRSRDQAGQFNQASVWQLVDPDVTFGEPCQQTHTKLVRNTDTFLLLRKSIDLLAVPGRDLRFPKD